MYELKSISADAVAEALRKAERYRLLNEPSLAESICEDILRVEPDNQDALRMLLLAVTDGFGDGAPLARAKAILPRIEDEYDRLYHTGIVFERWANMWLRGGRPGGNFRAYDCLREAMHWFERAEEKRPVGNDDAVLRWNTCARILMKNPELRAQDSEQYEPVLED